MKEFLMAHMEAIIVAIAAIAGFTVHGKKKKIVMEALKAVVRGVEMGGEHRMSIQDTKTTIAGQAKKKGGKVFDFLGKVVKEYAKKDE